MSTITQRLAEAMRLHQAGQLAQAEPLYRGVLHESPRHPQALQLLATLASQTGRDREAMELFIKALAAQGPHPVLLSNLASACIATGDLAAAEGHSRHALRLSPGLVPGHLNLGVALRRQGRYAEAEAAFREACRLAPAEVNARCNLGAVLQDQGRFPEALAVLEETVRLAPRSAQAHNDLGGALLRGEQPERAAEALREAVRLRPAFVEAHSNLGLALRHLHRSEEAMQCFREALRLNPDYTAARCNLGAALESVGQMSEAVAEHQEALRRSPASSMALSSLGKLAADGFHQLSDAERRGLEELTARPELPVEDRCRGHFALASLLDREGDTDAAFDHYRRGNDLRRERYSSRGQDFDPAECRRYMDRLMTFFTPEYFASVRPFGVESALPVFVVGMMRSGTTLVEQILASHPRVFGAGELPDVDRLVAAIQARVGAEYPECLTRLTPEAARELAEGHVAGLRARGGEAERVVDKHPFNFRHLGLIATLFPQARIVHCRRDPVDTCLSCYFQNFGSPHPFTHDLRHLGEYYREYERLMAHWATVLPVEVFEVRYEELTAEPEAVSRRLVAYCGLEWDERCLRFHEGDRAVRTASVRQVRQPIYRRSVGRWKRYERHLGPLLEELGLE